MLGRPAHRVEPRAAATELDAALRALIAAGGRPFVYAKVPAADVATAVALQARGFRVVDASVIFEKDIRPGAPAPAVPCGEAAGADAADVGRIAREGFAHSRFHLDPAFPRAVADGVKEAWAQNYFSGHRGDRMVVAREEGRVSGFALLLAREDAWIVDLIAVDPAARRRGVARAMLDHVARTADGRARVTLGTQLANLPSLGFYARCGFVPVDSGYVLHFHGET